MSLHAKFEQGLPYREFLERYANDLQKQRWQAFYEQVRLTPEQRTLLGSFPRSMRVLCLAGAWCGDCINQCPIFRHFEEASPKIALRFIDRDEHADAQKTLQVNGGDRVPVVVFFSEDGFEVSRFGDRTLSRYRQMMRDQVGDSCATGIAVKGDPLLDQVVQDWLNEFERVQWILRLSGRLRKLHND